MAWAWTQEVKYQPKFVLIALADLSDDFGRCWPGFSWIAERTGMSKGAVAANIARLGELKLINVTHRMKDEKTKTSNLYRLSIPDDFAISKKQRQRGISESGIPSPESVVGSPESDVPTPESVPNPSYDSFNNLTKKKRRGFPATPEPQSDHQFFIEWFCKAYQDHTGEPYHFRGKVDGPLVKHLLSQFGLEKVQQVAEAMLDSNDPFIAKNGRTIGMLSAQWNKLSTGKNGNLFERIMNHELRDQHG